jgi:hypothetical protein
VAQQKERPASARLDRASDAANRAHPIRHVAFIYPNSALLLCADAFWQGVFSSAMRKGFFSRERATTVCAHFLSCSSENSPGAQYLSHIVFSSPFVVVMVDVSRAAFSSVDTATPAPMKTAARRVKNERRFMIVTFCSILKLHHQWS